MGGHLSTDSAFDRKPTIAVPTRRHGQSRAGSLAEAVTQVVVGFLLAFVVQGLIYPLFEIVTTPETEVSMLMARSSKLPLGGTSEGRSRRVTAFMARLTTTLSP